MIKFWNGYIMPQYEFKNNETGEIMEVTLRISEYDEWKENNLQ
jgi:predicted nucleic acid-binding Zn ribbon protein